MGNWIVSVSPPKAKLAGLYYTWVATTKSNMDGGSGEIWQNHSVTKDIVKQFVEESGWYADFMAWTNHPERMLYIQGKQDALTHSIVERQTNLYKWDLAWKQNGVTMLWYENDGS